MTPEEIERLIDRLEDDRHCSCYADGSDSHWCERCQAASALRFLLKEREDLIQATPAKDLAHCDQLHAAEWQTIETAPKDGTEILVCGGTFYYDQDTCPSDARLEGTAKVCWNRHHGEWQGEYGSEYDGQYWHKPALWMPLPSPPQRQGDRPELPNDLRSRETKTSGENP